MKNRLLLFSFLVVAAIVAALTVLYSRPANKATTPVSRSERWWKLRHEEKKALSADGGQHRRNGLLGCSEPAN
jgi:hypothetical protein